MSKIQKMWDLQTAAHVMGVRTSTMLALTESLERCPVGEAGLEYVEEQGKYYFTPEGIANWLRLRLGSVYEWQEGISGDLSVRR